MAQKRNLTKEKIIEATLICANQVGDIDHVTFQLVAKELAIKYPSLYNHFANMRELKNHCSFELYRRLNQQLQEKLVGKTRGEAIEIYATVYKEFALHYFGSYKLLTNHRYLEADESSSGAHTHLQIIRAILQSYQLHDETLIHASRSIRSTVHGFISLYMLGYFQSKDLVDADQTFAFMIQQIVQQLETTN